MRTYNLGPLIAAFSSSVLSFIAGQYLPYVITVISGSGAIAAVPLAIFTVSTVVALASVAYLVKSAVSRVGNEKEAGLSTETPRRQIEQSAQGKEEGKLTRESAGTGVDGNDNLNIPGNNNVPPPPLPPQGAVPPIPPLPPFSPVPGLEPKLPAVGGNRASLLDSIRQASGKPGKRCNGEASSKEQPSNNGGGQQTGYADELSAKLQNNKNNSKQETAEEYAARLDKVREDRQKRQNQDMASILARRMAVEYSDTENGHSSSDNSSGWSTDEEKSKNKKLIKCREKSTPPSPPSDHRERSESPDSGNVSGNDVESKPTSPLHFSAPQTRKPSLLPKPANLPERPQAPPATKENDVGPVNSEMLDPSTFPVNWNGKVKNLTNFWKSRVE